MKFEISLKIFDKNSFLMISQWHNFGSKMAQLLRHRKNRPKNQTDNPWSILKPEMIWWRPLLFVNCNFDTLLVRIMSPETFFDVHFVIVQEYLFSGGGTVRFWPWLSAGKEDIKREETISSISLPYSVFLYFSKGPKIREEE